MQLACGAVEGGAGKSLDGAIDAAAAGSRLGGAWVGEPRLAEGHRAERQLQSNEDDRHGRERGEQTPSSGRRHDQARLRAREAGISASAASNAQRASERRNARVSASWTVPTTKSRSRRTRASWAAALRSNGVARLGTVPRGARARALRSPRAIGTSCWMGMLE